MTWTKAKYIWVLWSYKKIIKDIDNNDFMLMKIILTPILVFLAGTLTRDGIVY